MTRLSADYIIIGGGTAGLVVANRLSEDPNVSVLILEAGPDGSADERVQNPAAWPTLSGSEMDWQFKTVPQPGLNNRDQDHPAGRLLGGTSAINGLAFVPPAPAGIDAWEALGNPGWSWQSLAPYFHRSFHCPNTSTTGKGPATGPIEVTYPALAEPRNHALINAWNQTLADKGYAFSDTLIPSPTTGTRPYTATITTTGLRSASTEYVASRPNLRILTNTTVERILFDTTSPSITATGVLLHNDPSPITATREVILAAGALNTPKLLELSGIGCASRLSTHNIPCLINNPSVGENLQNHLMAMIPIPIQPSAETTTPAPGIQAISFIRTDTDTETDLLTQHPAHLPLQSSLHTLLSNPSEPTACFFLSTLPNSIALLGLIPCYPLSRGSVHISSGRPTDKPTINPNFLSHPFDLKLMAEHYKTLTSLPTSSPLNEILGPIQDVPVIEEALKESAIAAHHSCGTASMAPREKGGVVDTELRVYGTGNLRVVDASVFPVVTVANPVGTVYAVAERAGEIIRGSFK